MSRWPSKALDYDALADGDLIVLQGVRNPSSGLISALLRSRGKPAKCLPDSPGRIHLVDGWDELLIGLGSGPTRRLGLPWMSPPDSANPP